MSSHESSHEKEAYGEGIKAGDVRSVTLLFSRPAGVVSYRSLPQTDLAFAQLVEDEQSHDIKRESIWEGSQVPPTDDVPYPQSERVSSSGGSACTLRELELTTYFCEKVSWQKAMYLLFGDQVCLAILAQCVSPLAQSPGFFTDPPFVFCRAWS